LGLGRNDELPRGWTKVGYVLRSDQRRGAAVPTVDISELGVAEVNRVLRHGLETAGVEIVRRTGDFRIIS
jgi:hypothetical protein